MAKVKISGSATGTATYTIQSPSGNTDRTLTLPDEAGTVLTSASDVAASALTGDIAAARITNALNAGGSAPIYACRAWVNFNGTGTVAIRESGNVSSITDNGTGYYTVNFTTAMPDTNYCANISANNTASFNAMMSSIDTGASGTITTTSARFFTCSNSSTNADARTVNFAVFR